MKIKLISMVQYTLEKYKEINNVFIDNVINYANFLNKDLTKSMFIGKETIFPDFVFCTPTEAQKLGHEKSIYNFGDNEFMICQLKKNYKGSKSCWLTSFHLKKIEDLVALDIDYIDYNNSDTNHTKN